MLFRSKSRFPKLSVNLNKPVKVLSAIFLVLVIAGVVYQERDNVIAYFKMVGLPALIFNVLSMGMGFYLPRLLKLEKRQAISIGMEIGIHNGTLAIYIALSVIGNSVVSISPAIYSLIMFFTAAAFGFLVNLKRG